ncbi:MAG: glycosyltransferase family 2 protein [Paracoccaceae bacterium]
MGTPVFTVMVCTYDRPQDLEKCLSSLEGQFFRDFEIVVVQGPPYKRDVSETNAVLERYKDKIRWLHIDENNIAKARNIALDAAHGRYTAMIDDDAIAMPNWLLSYQQAFERRPDISGFGGFARNPNGTIASQVVVCDRHASVYHYATEQAADITQRPGVARGFSLTGYNACFVTEAARDVGGFDDVFAYMFEETDLCFRLVDAGYLLGFQPNCWVTHASSESIDRLVKGGPRTYTRIFTSLAYFCHKHSPHDADAYSDAFADARRADIKAAVQGGKINKERGENLLADIAFGLREGRAKAATLNHVKR